MFNNIGKKIKALAKAMFWVGIAASFLIGVVLIERDSDMAKYGFLIMIAGSLVSWIGCFVLYGFGQLVDNSDILVAQIKGDQTKSIRRFDNANDTLGADENVRAPQDADI